MRGLRIVLFKSFFLLAVLFCAGSDSYRDYFQRQTGCETVSYVNYNENIGDSYDTYSDSLNDDQIDSSFDNDMNEEASLTESIPEIPVLICNFPVSVWQPPKNS